MQSVILAGGLGTRLRPLTYEIPKPMVSINGKPFLEYVISLLKANDLKNILFLVGYLGEQIEDYFGDGAKLGLNISYSYEENPLGTGGALKNAESKLEEEFLILNGDTYLPIDFRELIELFHTQNKIGAITVYNNVENIVPNNILLDDSNLVLKYNKKDPSGMTHLDAGVSIFKKDVLGFIPEEAVCSLEEKIFPLLIVKKELIGFPINKRFYDIGTFERLKMFKEILK